MAKIVGIAGEAGAGKDTFAQPLVERGFVKASFAGNLKEMCQYIFGLSPYHTDTQEGKLEKLTVPVPFTKIHFNKIIQWITRTHDIRACTAQLTAVEKKYIVNQIKREGRPLYFRTPREVLQFVGTEICRAVHENYHAEVLYTKIISSNMKWVITDVRFPNERAMVKKLGGVLVRIKRPGFIQMGLNTAHASEASLGADTEYDVLVNNTGTIQDLHKATEQFV